MWENKEWKVTQGYDLLFSTEKSAFPAKLSKNDLDLFEGKTEEICQNSVNFCFFLTEYQNSYFQKQKIKLILKQMGFPNSEFREFVYYLEFWEENFMQVRIWKIVAFWRVFGNFNAILSFIESFYIQRVNISRFWVL